MQVGLPHGHILGGADGDVRPVGGAVLKGGAPVKALGRLGQGGQHILGPHRRGGAAAHAALAGQHALIAQAVDLLGHPRPVGLGLLGRIVHALILGRPADGPVEAAGLVVSHFRVHKVVAHLGVFLQPVAQRAQGLHVFVQQFAHLGRHAHQRNRLALLHPHHGPDGLGKAAGGEIAHHPHAVLPLVFGGHGLQAAHQHQPGQGQRRYTCPGVQAFQPHAAPKKHRQHQPAGQPEGQQPHTVLPAKPGGRQPRPGQQQPGQAFAPPPRRPQGIAGQPGKEQQAQGREDVVPIHPQGIAGAGRGQKRQHPEHRQLPPAGFQHGSQRRRHGQGRRRPQQLPGDQVGQAQLLQRGQPQGKQRMLGQREVIVLAQPVPGGDALGRVEIQFVVQRCAVNPGIEPLLAGQRGLHRKHSQHRQRIPHH